MAFCPKCKGEMATTATVCPHCGYDFPPEDASDRRSGLAYGRLAQLGLLVGQVVSGLACIMVLVESVLALLSGQWLDAFIRGPIVALLLLGMFVVFARV